MAVIRVRGSKTSIFSRRSTAEVSKNGRREVVSRSRVEKERDAKERMEREEGTYLDRKPWGTSLTEELVHAWGGTGRIGGSVNEKKDEEEKGQRDLDETGESRSPPLFGRGRVERYPTYVLGALKEEGRGQGKISGRHGRVRTNKRARREVRRSLRGENGRMKRDSRWS